MYPGTIASWDGYGHITKFVNYSQLVQPTSIGFANTAVLYFDDVGNFTQASSGPCRGITEHAFVAPNSRNWLSTEECVTIKMLFNKANLDSLSDRVARAHWSVQHAAYQYFFEVRTMLVAAGLDALVHARVVKGPAMTGAQFIQRTAQLAQELGSISRRTMHLVFGRTGLMWRTVEIHGSQSEIQRSHNGKCRE